MGASRDFDGTDDKINWGDISALDGLTAITAMAWVRWDGGVSVGIHSVSRKSDAAVTNSIYALGMGWDAASDKARFWIVDYNGGDSIWKNSGDGTTAIDDGSWHHLAGTYDGTAIRIYVNGVEESSTTDAGLTIGSSSATSPVHFGASQTVELVELWNGKLAWGNCYSRALSTEEINDEMWYPQTVLDGLELCAPLWGLDSPEIDLSGNGHSGTVTGAVESPDGPPVYQRAPLIFVPTAAAPGNAMPMAMHSYRRRRVPA